MLGRAHRGAVSSAESLKRLPAEGVGWYYFNKLIPVGRSILRNGPGLHFVSQLKFGKCSAPDAEPGSASKNAGSWGPGRAFCSLGTAFWGDIPLLRPEEGTD